MLLHLSQEVEERTRWRCLTRAITSPAVLLSVVTFASQLQVPGQIQTCCVPRAAGMGSAKHAGSPCQWCSMLCFDPIHTPFLNNVITAEEIGVPKPC